MLKGEKAEEAILDERAAHAKARVVVANFLLSGREGAFCTKQLVAIEVVGRAVQLVGPGLQAEIDRAARVTAAFGTCLGLRGELIDGIDGEDDAGNAGDAALINSGDVVPEVVVVDAVDLPVHLVGACAVETAVAAAGVAGVA